MVKQLYYEDVDEGEEVPVLVKSPTNRQLVKFTGASGDYYEIHYDKDFALNQLLGAKHGEFNHFTQGGQPFRHPRL